MSEQTNQKQSISESVQLAPSHRLPILIILLGLIFLPVPIFFPWLTILITSFGLFLLLQSFILRLEFTSDDLVVLQLGKELRRFPFKYWLSWRLILPKLPGFFYFREEASPHLLPILFDRKMLEDQLRQRVGNLEVSQESDQKP
tara:strand:+ start:51 stop:482 length:432 start_codon:yes stop_codon:yes gene_type:complete